MTTTTTSNEIQDLHESLQDFFQGRSVRDLVGDRRGVLSFRRDLPIDAYMRELSQHFVRSAPLDPESGSRISTADAEFVDFSDVVRGLLSFIDQHQQQAGDGDALNDEHAYKRFMATPVKDITNGGRMDRYDVIRPDATAFEAAKKLLADDDRGKPLSPVKRLLVTGAQERGEGGLVNVVTLSDILHMIKTYIDLQHQRRAETENSSSSKKNQELLQLTVSQLNLGATLPPSVAEDQTALDAFRAMSQSKQSFVPIVSSEDGALLSVISVRDIKILVSELCREKFGSTFQALSLPVMDFVGLTRQATPDDKYPYISCKGTDPIELIVRRLRATHVHRLLLVNEQRSVTGVVNVRSVCQQIIARDDTCLREPNRLRQSLRPKHDER